MITSHRFMAIMSGLSLLALCLVVAAPVNAQLLGATVTGDMFVGIPGNFFDPANGGVPAGFLNSAPGTNVVTVAEPAVEFGFRDGANQISVNFTANTLTLHNVSDRGAAPITYTFSSAAFNGLLLSEVSDNFPAGGSSASLIGNTLTINTLNYVGLSGTFTAVYNIASAAPEPGSLALLALTGLPLVGAVVQRNRILARRHRSSASLPCPSLR